MAGLRGLTEVVQQTEHRDFAALGVREAPLADPAFGDVGQVYAPRTVLTWLAAHTSRITLAAGSMMFPLRRPINLAEQAATVGHLSGVGRYSVWHASTIRWNSRRTVSTMKCVAPAARRWSAPSGSYWGAEQPGGVGRRPSLPKRYTAVYRFWPPAPPRRFPPSAPVALGLVP
ncbi:MULTISPECIES: LLM class flavin-dependent oxidoreductase [unclassified Streptomyces]|uniref:LLM class flavin-dependent oxidoreductase n=1 Tax=unclassified Streptomyces TaxID=2593676 RepID=UPI00093B40C0|nr:LLM class flavin-dependent oxidoreductase [Streptomyces sp. CB01580]